MRSFQDGWAPVAFFAAVAFEVEAFLVAGVFLAGALAFAAGEAETLAEDMIAARDQLSGWGTQGSKAGAN